MGFGRSGEEISTELEVQSHSSGDQILTGVSHLGCEVYFLKEASQLCGVDVMQTLGGRMRKVEQTRQEEKQPVKPVKPVKPCVSSPLGMCRSPFQKERWRITFNTSSQIKQWRNWKSGSQRSSFKKTLMQNSLVPWRSWLRGVWSRV